MHSPVPAARPLVTAASLFLVFAYTMVGCAVWRPIPTSGLPDLIRQERPSRVRIVRGDTLVEVHRPSVVADTLRGTARTAGDERSVLVPMNAIDSAAVRANNRKLGRVLAISAVVYAAVFLASVSHPGPLGFP